MPSKVMLYNKHGRLLPIDEILLLDTPTNALVKISYAHHKVHEALSFTTSYTDETLADAETMVVAFKTPSGENRVHIFVFFSTLVGGSLELWEKPTWTTNTGTANPIINRRRDEHLLPSTLLEDLTATPTFTPTQNVLVGSVTGMTLSTVGAISLDKQYAWGEKGKVGAGYLRDENEFILESDTTYAVVFTAIGASNKANVSLNWYEHKDVS